MAVQAIIRDHLYIYIHIYICVCVFLEQGSRESKVERKVTSVEQAFKSLSVSSSF